jgi:hypothetical protein
MSMMFRVSAKMAYNEQGLLLCWDLENVQPGTEAQLKY